MDQRVVDSYTRSTISRGSSAANTTSIFYTMECSELNNPKCFGEDYSEYDSEKYFSSSYTIMSLKKSPASRNKTPPKRKKSDKSPVKNIGEALESQLSYSNMVDPPASSHVVSHCNPNALCFGLSSVFSLGEYSVPLYF